MVSATKTTEAGTSDAFGKSQPSISAQTQPLLLSATANEAIGNPILPGKTGKGNEFDTYGDIAVNNADEVLVGQPCVASEENY